MKMFNVTIIAEYEKKFTVEANSIDEAENIIDNILGTTNLLDVNKEEVNYLVEIESKKSIDNESACEDCPCYDGEECLYDELY